MSRRLRTVTELVVVTLFASPLVTPLLRWNVVPCTHDGHLHYHRVVAMLHAWRSGLFFSRWLPDLAFGYGYPFFLYREPLPLYLTLWPHLLGLPMPAAINLFYIACVITAGCFTYLWVRDIFGARAALVSAVAYMAAPYQLVDALVRGNQVESLALALFPFILWSGRRFMHSGRARWFLVSTLGVAILALSHNISLLLFTPALILYLLFTGWLAGLQWQTVVLRLALVAGLGLVMTSFYTAPAVLEIDEVTLTLSTSNRNNDFRFNFASLSEILAPVSSEDPALINPPLPLRLGWAPALLAVLGLLAYKWMGSREQKGHILFMGAGALTYIFFALPQSQPLWEAIPLIEFVQFPWRFVGRAALPVAVLAGAPFAGILSMLRPDRAPRGVVRPLAAIAPVLAAITILLLEAMPLLYPSYCVEQPFPTIAAVHEYEQVSGMVGVDPVGSYFPVTVRQRPQSSPLLADYETGVTPQRFDSAVLPPTADLVAASYGPLRAEFEVDSPEAFRARYLTFAFPGWTATVDGEPVAITPEDPSGLITFPVPAGRHMLVVSWRLTPLRVFGGAASLLAAAAVVIAAALLSRRAPAPRQQFAEPAGLSPKAVYLSALAALLLLGFKLLVVDRVPTPLQRVAAPAVEVQANLSAGGLQLAGYNLSRQAVPSGETFDIDLAWQVQQAPELALQSNVWLRDAQGLVWSDRETQRPRIYEETPPTTQWQPGQWAWDSREVAILPGTPPGRYQIVLTLFNLADLQPLTLSQGSSAVGPTAVLGEIEVLPAQNPPQFRPQYGLAQQVAGLTLLGYNQDREAAQPGDPLLLTLFWEKPAASPQAPAQMELSLRDEAGDAQLQWQIAPVHPSYPPQQWRVGERLRGQQLLRLPASLDSGEYRLWLEDVALGQLTIEAPLRQFERPAFDHTGGWQFGSSILLAGYTLEMEAAPDGAQNAAPRSLAVTLVWQALEDTEISYTVFVHLLSAGGAIIAQSDAEPAQWARPTTGWARGEYIVDEHVLSIPAEAAGEDLALRIGLFDPLDGARLLLPDGADHILIQP